MFGNFIAKHKLTVVGIISAITSVLLAFGVIDLETQAAVQEGATNVIDAAASSENELAAFITALLAFIGIFGKDGDTGTTE